MKRKNKRTWLLGCLCALLVLSLGTSPLFAKSVEQYQASYEDEEVRITVRAPLGTLPEHAVFSATKITPQSAETVMETSEKTTAQKINEQYQNTAQLVEGQGGEEVAGFLAYDLFFTLHGIEVEPTGAVDVNMEFKQPVKPDGVEEARNVIVQHVKETSDGLLLETLDQQSEVTINAQTEVEKVQLTTSSFSIFTLTWNSYYSPVQSQVKFKLLDEAGNAVPIENKQTEIYLDDEFRVENIFEMINQSTNFALNNYCLKYAYVQLQHDQEVVNQPITSLLRDNSENGKGNVKAKYNEKEYDAKDWVKETNETQPYVYLVLESFHEIATIDSTKLGVTLKLKDANGKQFSGAEWDDNPYGKNIKQGILAPVLQNGYPTFSGNYNTMINNQPAKGQSLSQFYQNAVSVNHLFLKSSYDQDGYFYFNSAENGAILDSSTNKFNVYKELFTPMIDNNDSVVQRGNFLPLNQYNPSVKANNRSLYNENGELLKPGDIGYQAELYAPIDAVNYEFSMELSASFIQMENGIYKDKPMRYEFNGDDDLWVYIDGALALDLGGCHDARGGWIDFSSGLVGFQIGLDESYGRPTAVYKTVFLKDLMMDAGISDASDWKEIKLADGTTSYIFQDYTKHELNMWYMERGRGASNLKVRFNLPVVPKGQLQVHKEMPEGVVYGEQTFAYELYMQTYNAEGTIIDPTYQQVTDFTKFDAKLLNGQPLRVNDGKFYLKPGETATFDKIPQTVGYYVKEVGLSASAYDKVVINGQEHVLQSADTEVVSTKETLNHRPSILFRNVPNKEQLSNFTIEKQMKTGQTSQASYDVQVSVMRNGTYVPYQGVYTLQRGSHSQQLTSNDGILSLQATDTITITNILSGTKIKVEEINLGQDYETPDYQVEQLVNESTDAAYVIVTTNQNFQGKLLITNEKKVGSLIIHKKISTDSHVDMDDGDPIFTFKITKEDLSYVTYRTIRLSDVLREGSVTISDLPFGTYTVTELDTLRYESQSPIIQTVKLQKDQQTVTYVNKLVREDSFSHTDVVENQFYTDEQGIVHIKANNLKQSIHRSMINALVKVASKEE